ncbi:hypothetical protein FOC1_g10011318, partial [Fusarium oxysporum f. sp. cubense race 1]
AGLDLVSTYLLESRRIPRQREREREIGCRATSAVDSPGQAIDRAQLIGKEALICS